MKIEPYVGFVVKYTEPENYGHEQTVKDVDGLKHYINCQGLGRVVSYEILIERQLYFVADNRYALKTNNGQNITTDKIKIIVAKKLTYFSDLHEYLNKNALGNACQDVTLRNFAQFEQNKPIFFTGRYEHNGSFLPNPPVSERPLVCRPLTDNDIVVDNNLRQIWPTKTNKIPVALRTMFRKKTERVK
jgi:hypothetical protein